MFFMRSIFKVIINGPGWKTKYFSKTLTLHCLKSSKNNIQIYRLGTSLTAFSGLRSFKLLKLHQCEIESCIYVGNEAFSIPSPWQLQFAIIFLDHSFLNLVPYQLRLQGTDNHTDSSTYQ